MKMKRKSGFTLAEMLLTIAIIAVLLGVAFIAFMRQQRTMTRLEYDSIAKEIYVAAQNHLTSAQSQGYLRLDSSAYGTQGKYKDADTDDKDVVWYVINGASAPEILNLMLPNYALDGAALSGSYIIRYQPSAGLVLDVFYSRPGQLSFLTVTGTTLGSGDYTYDALMAGCRGDDKLSARNGYGSENAVIGWYGNENPVERGERLAVPSFEIINAEQLLVKVNDPNGDKDFASLKLIVIGKKSGAEKYFRLVRDGSDETNDRERSSQGTLYSLILDDITYKDSAGTLHFADVVNNPDVGESFYPGEDVTVKVVAYSNTKLANIAMSDEKVTNSLFANPDTDPTDTKIDGSNIENGIAAIANIRHLENLDKKVSSFIPSYITISNITAKQMTDLSWPDFMEKTGKKEDIQIYYTSESTKNKCFYPISPDYPLVYDGQNNAVSNVKVDHSGNAGLFGALSENDSEIKNLELIDFDITGTTSAGALAGAVTNTTITNVVAHNSEDNDSKFDNDDTTTGKKPNVTATGAAGGLIGSMSGGSVTKSAAAVYVKGGTDAGGLIGSAASGEVKACYSGGHTYSGVPTGAAQKYDDAHKDVYPVRYYDADNNPMYNVTATGGTAGGLIGSAGTATISNSYSTCSTSGTTAGGFVGTGGAISNSYCTGLVKGTTAEGAFAASVNSVSGSHFFEIINERSNTDSSGKPADYDYLKPLGKVEADATTGITALDASADTYNSFSGAPANWKEAIPYDAGGTETFGLKVYYRKTDGKTGYNLQTVEQLSGGDGSLKTSEGDTTDYFVATHYGDWPAPEEFIFN